MEQASHLSLCVPYLSLQQCLWKTAHKVRERRERDALQVLAISLVVFSLSLSLSLKSSGPGTWVDLGRRVMSNSFPRSSLTSQGVMTKTLGAGTQTLYLTSPPCSLFGLLQPLPLASVSRPNPRSLSGRPSLPGLVNRPCRLVLCQCDTSWSHRKGGDLN